MRIRKHAKLAGLSLTATSPSGFSADLTPHGSSYRFHCPHHICQLNQSPWDVLPFPPDSPSSPFQVDGEESNYTANGSSANSLGAVESVASMRISMDMEDKNVNHNKNGIGLGFGNGGTISCCKTVGKGLKCKMEAWKGHSLCQHHLPHQLRVYDSLSAGHPSAAAKKLEKPVTGPIRRRRGRPRKVQVPPPPPPTVVNPYEFYYYSGFGPRWGRKRGVSHIAKSERVEEEEKEKEINVRERVLHSSILVSSSEMDSDEFDYVEDKKEEDEENNANAKKKKMKRGRKPIKARSLKSLM